MLHESERPLGLNFLYRLVHTGASQILNDMTHDPPSRINVHQAGPI